MTDFPDSHRDLLDAEFATLGTIDSRGFPQLIEVWFLFDEDEVKVSLNTTRLKTMNMQARPKCSLFILDLANAYRYLEVRRSAGTEPAEDYDFADKIGTKHGRPSLRTIDQPGESRVVVTIEPVNVWPVNKRGRAREGGSRQADALATRWSDLRVAVR